jgi:hypothetical protein
MNKMILVLAVVLCSYGGAGATEWTTPEALRAFGKPGDTVRGSVTTSGPQRLKKGGKSSGAQVEETNDAATGVTPAIEETRPVAKQKPGSPALQKELNAIYGRFYEATRAGNFNEQLKYVTGAQKRIVEKVINSPDDQKDMLKQMMGNLAGSYSVTGCSVAPDGKSAILNTKRMVPVYNAQGDKTGDQESIGTIEFIKVGSTWKISLVAELS